jgi:simple sugar transport system permease protein
MGAIGAAFISLQFSNLPGILLIGLMILAAMLAGSLWGGIAAFLKVWFNASELINTIMLNYIAIFFSGYLLHGPLQDPGSPLGQTSPVPGQAYLGILLPGTRLHAGLLVALAAALIAAGLLWRTTWGFRLRLVGKNPEAARNAGTSVAWVLVSALMVSGALAGLAGFSEVAGVQHRMIENISPGYGYTAIVVALLGQTNPLGVLAAAVLFAALQVGASTMESAVHVPSSVVTIIQYLVVILIIGRGAFDWLRQRMNVRTHPA